MNLPESNSLYHHNNRDVFIFFQMVIAPPTRPGRGLIFPLTDAEASWEGATKCGGGMAGNGWKHMNQNLGKSCFDVLP